MNLEDRPNYGRADSGCEMATKKLGYQSLCLKNCPFTSCCLDNSEKFTVEERDKLITRMAERKTPGQIAVELSLDWRLV